MAISVQARKLLWGRAGNICSMENCGQALTEVSIKGDHTVIGEECHIVADSDEGPRAIPSMPQAERDDYPNLILLCPTHHTVIDKSVSDWSVVRLLQMKAKHEAWVQATLSASQVQDDNWLRRVADSLGTGFMFDEWDVWTQDMLVAPSPIMKRSTRKSINNAASWVLGLLPPPGLGWLKDDLKRLCRIMNDVVSTFGKHAASCGDGEYEFEKFYQIREWDTQRYNRLFAEYEQQVNTMHSLVFEATRMANWIICQIVRHYPTFRAPAPLLRITRGDEMDDKGKITMRYYAPQYSGEEQVRGNEAYTTLEAFQELRKTRDWWME